MHLPWATFRDRGRGCVHPGLTCSAHPYVPVTPYKWQTAAEMVLLGFRDRELEGQVSTTPSYSGLTIKST